MFQKILIANRGEIACRVIKTARRLGVQTVAVFSDADREAMHVKLADEAYHIGKSEALESYLDGAKLIGVAQKSGAQAIHPGYGFLSENPDFAKACNDAGIVFIGPSAQVIADMGDKFVAKEMMENAGLPIIPGFNAKGYTNSQIAQKVSEVGYPIIIKPVAGGGGKGMRLVSRREELDEALASATREAKASFGNDTLLIEKYLESPRHVEVQVFGDAHGNCVHLFERDCTLQRRHQKVVEEAPAFGLSEDERARIGKIAVNAAQSVGYCGAGTIEFLRDKKGDFYFIEMNTRLQVEHPVTEMITGFDLVEWQLRVASGEHLPATQQEISIDGHAIEVRLYAEDSQNGFLPSTGSIHSMYIPPLNETVRLDTGVEAGGAISRFYDPMIAKLIVKAQDRPAALNQMLAALGAMNVQGVETNIGFLQRLLKAPEVLAEQIDTNFIERHITDLISPVPPVSEDVLMVVLKILADRDDHAKTKPWGALSYWRMNGEHNEEFLIRSSTQDFKASVTFKEKGLEIDLGETFFVEDIFQQNGRVEALIGGEKKSTFVVRSGASIKVSSPRGEILFDYENPVSASEKAEEHTGSLASPMPGKVIAVNVKKGDKVSQGDPLVTIEAMKMEHTIKATVSGMVESVSCQPGDVIEEGVDMLKIAAS